MCSNRLNEAAKGCHTVEVLEGQVTTKCNETETFHKHPTSPQLGPSPMTMLKTPGGTSASEAGVEPEPQG